MLQSLLSSDMLDSARRAKYSVILDTEMKNRVGEVATDFEFMLRDGERGRLSEINAKYILVFFSDPAIDATQSRLRLTLRLSYASNYCLVILLCCRCVSKAILMRGRELRRPMSG